MGVTALDIKKVCLRCVAVIIVAFVMPTGIWLYARSASRFGRVAAVAAGVAMGEYKPWFRYGKRNGYGIKACGIKQA